MANYDSVSAMMNTKENMEHLVVGTKHDDDVMQFVGVDWFNFNGTPISNIFVSGNSFIGLGTNTEHLLVCRRDTAMYDFYRGQSFRCVPFFENPLGGLCTVQQHFRRCAVGV